MLRRWLRYWTPLRVVEFLVVLSVSYVTIW
jgi:hypothetical protein